MCVRSKRHIPLALILLLSFSMITSCAQQYIVRDPIPDVKVSRSNFIRGIIDATSSGMVNDELKTAILSFVDIYNSNQDNPGMRIADDYKIYFNVNDQCYHVVDRDKDIAVNIKGAGIAHAYISQTNGMGEDGRADGYKALIKSFQSGGYIPESVVADMAKIQAKAYSMGNEGLCAFNTMEQAMGLIDGSMLVDTGIDYTVPDMAITAPVIDTTDIENYGAWDMPLNEEIEQKSLEPPTIATPAPLATFGAQPQYTFSPMEQGDIPALPNITPAPSGNTSMDLDAAGRRQALTSASMSDDALASWNNAKQGIEDGKNILLTPNTPIDNKDRGIADMSETILDPGSLLNALPDNSQKLKPAATPQK